VAIYIFICVVYGMLMGSFGHTYDTLFWLGLGLNFAAVLVGYVEGHRDASRDKETK